MSCELITLWLPVAETHTQEEDYFPSITVRLTYNQSFPPVSTSPPQPSPTFFFFLSFFIPLSVFSSFLFLKIIQKSSFQVHTKFKGEKVKKVSWLWLFRKG